MLNDPPDDDADLWLNLKSRLQKGQDGSMPSPDSWHYSPNLDVPRQQAEDDWLTECSRYREQVNSLVMDWIQKCEVPPMEERVRFFFCARFVVAREFVSHHTWLCHGQWTTVFPFPRRDTESVLRLFLVDWWEGVGQFQAFHDGYQEKLIP